MNFAVGCIIGLLLAAPLAGAAAGPDPYNCTAYCGTNYGGNSSKGFYGKGANVLLIGDSISMKDTGYYESVMSILDTPKLASVQHMGTDLWSSRNISSASPPKICGTSFGVVACADTFTKPGPFDVIHFNWGLHDVCAAMYAPVTDAQYVENMKQVLAPIYT
jgi:hypothetical protein